MIEQGENRIRPGVWKDELGVEQVRICQMRSNSLVAVGVTTSGGMIHGA